MSAHTMQQSLLPSRKRVAQVVAALFVSGAGAAHATCPVADGNGTITVNGVATTPCVLNESPARSLIVEGPGSIVTIGGPSASVEFEKQADVIYNSGTIRQNDGGGQPVVLLESKTTLNFLENRAGGLIVRDMTPVGSGVMVSDEARILQFENEQGAEISANDRGVDNRGRIDVLTNEGLIEGGDLLENAGIYNAGLIESLVNRGSILGRAGIFNAKADILELINRGLIDGDGSADISNDGFIEYLENAQARLSLEGNLPEHYATVINGQDAGGLDYSSGFLNLPQSEPSVALQQIGNGCMQFDIAPDSVVTQTTYPNVLTGIFPEQLCGTQGTFQGRSWTLQPTAIDIADSGSEISVQDSHAAWDLIFGEAVAPTSIPTLSHLGLAVLATLMGLIGLRSRRRLPT